MVFVGAAVQRHVLLLRRPRRGGNPQQIRLYQQGTAVPLDQPQVQLRQPRTGSIAHFSSWFGSPVVRASNLRLSGREFDPLPPRYRSVGTGLGDRLRSGIPYRYVTSHPGQLSLLPSVGRKMSNETESKFFI